MNLQESIRRVLREDYDREYILYRAVGLDEAIKSCEVGHLVYYSRDPMSRDWEVIEYGLGDEASEMSEEEVHEYVNNLVSWVPNRKGVNLTSDLDNAKGYSDIVLEINLVGYDYAEFSDVHIFAKNPDDCKIKSVYYNGKEYTKEGFLDIAKSLQENIRRILKEERKPPNYIKRRYTCMDEYITKLESGEETIPIRMGRLDWNSYQIMLTAFIRSNCDNGNRYYDPIIHSKIMDTFGDRLYEWYNDNVDI
jgi:hypothetical protein